MSKASLTTNAFLNGQIQIVQSRDGYRYSLDAVLLAAAVRPKAGDTIVDLGTGCAIIPLILAYRFKGIHVTAVELQGELAAMAVSNVAANHMQDRITVLKDDVRQLKIAQVGGPVDWVISNPPFYPSGSGRINPDDQKALARHEIHLNLAELLQSARRLLRTGGQFATIYPSERIATLLCKMSTAGIEPKWMQFIHSTITDAAKLVLVRGVMAGKPGLKVERPLVICQSDGSYTSEVQAMMMP